MKKYLDKKLNRILTDANIAGMSVAVTDRSGLLYANGFGVNSIDNLQIKSDEKTLYRIASITKVVTGLVIMKLCEQGILNLNTPAGQYVPWLKRPGDAQNKMTLYHLLSHTSGLPQEYTPDGPREESALEDSLKKELECVEVLSQPEEEKYLYSNLGIRLASYIAERQTKKAYTHLAGEYVLNPLGMDYSTYDLRVASTYPLSIPHEGEHGALKAQHYIKENAARMAAGGLYSNVVDLSKLARCLLNNGKADSGAEVVSAKTIEQMMTPVSDAKNDYVDSYGLTLMMTHYKDGILAGHLGDASPYGAGLFVDTHKGCGAVVLMNTFRSDLRKKVPEMILEML